jgi:Catalytic LigB subunit of aromatic ring-opening dioxygenase
MGEILGIGMSHAPMFAWPDENMADILRRDLRRDNVPAELRDPSNWPAPMREEWGEDEGLAAAKRHRQVVVNGYRQLREELDSFNPDFVLIWGDDQYENFKEDIIPPFCVYVYDELDVLPFLIPPITDATTNVWGKPADHVLSVRGHRQAASCIAQGLIDRDFDVAYSFKPHHHPTLAHSFLNTRNYLDYDQQGFDYPMIPFHVNCYGRDVFRGRAGLNGDVPVPSAPTPRRCFDLGRAVASVIEESPWRAAVIGSSSWSHAFLTRKGHGLYPDVESDRARLVELRDSRHAEWRNLELETLVDAGQHEFLNWVCLAGAMAERKADVLAYGESWIFNSDKVAVVFRP